jgi:hypothetical protein
MRRKNGVVRNTVDEKDADVSGGRSSRNLHGFRVRNAWHRAIDRVRRARKGSRGANAVGSSVDVSLVLEATEFLDCELMNVHRRLRDLSAWPRESDLASIRVSLLTLLTLTRGLRNDAVAATLHSGSTDLRGAVLRARALVVATQLSVLTQAIEAREAREGQKGLTSERLSAFNRRVLGAIGRINATWAIEAEAAVTPAELDLVLSHAEAGYGAFRDDAEVAAFVLVGSTVDTGVVRSACRVLAAVLEVPIGSLAAPQ